MTELFLKIVNMSITASILVLLVLVLRLALKKAPKWVNVLLWGLVAVRLVCPFGVESRFSLMPKTDWIVQDNAYSEDKPAFDSIPDNISAVDLSSIGRDVTIHYDPTDPQIEVHRSISVPFILSCIWLVGMAAMLVYLAVSYFRIYRRIRSAKQFRDNIYTSEAVSSPFVFGVIKPRICLPEEMDAVNMSYVIAHEQAHISRKDHCWKPLGFLLLTVHWFNPMIWLGYIILCRDIEMACDEKVVRDMGDVERADYSEALLECSVKRSAKYRTMISACPLAFGEVGVKQRIRSVLHYKKPAFWIVVVAVIACIVAAVCFLTNPVSKTTDIRNIQPETLSAAENTAICSAVPPDTIWDFHENSEYFFSGTVNEEVYTTQNFVYDNSTIRQDYTITLKNHSTVPLRINIYRTADDKKQGTVSVKAEETVSVILSCENIWYMGVDTAWYTESQAEFSGWIHVQEETVQPNLLSADRIEEKTILDAYLNAKEEEEKLNSALDDYLQMQGYASDIGIAAADALGYTVFASGIKTLEKISTGTVGLSEEILLYRLEYWVTPHINGWDGTDSSDAVFGEVYFAMFHDWTTETWTRLGTITEVEIDELYNTAPMLEQYGNKYTAAASQMHHDYMRNNVEFEAIITAWEIGGYGDDFSGMLNLNLVEYITDEDSERIQELGLSEDDLLNGYYIHDPEENLTRFKIPAGTEFIFFDWDLMFTDPDDSRYTIFDQRWISTNDLSVFVEYLETYDVIVGESENEAAYPKMPFTFTVKDGKVTIREIFLM